MGAIDAEQVRTALDADGFCVIPDVLAADQVEEARKRLWEVVDEIRLAGVETHTSFLDPNPANVRVYNLPNHDRRFVDLLTKDATVELVRALLGDDAIISNLTANIARPGAEPMRIHSDMALVIPAPWHERWALNLIWCLSDIREENGATRYLPGSHKFTQMADLPADPEQRMKAFEAKAGSVIVLDGRVWHSSGANRTADEDRILLFGYYTRGFIRQQVNWHEVLDPPVIAAMDETQRALFGFGALANAHGAPLVLLEGR